MRHWRDPRATAIVRWWRRVCTGCSLTTVLFDRRRDGRLSSSPPANGCDTIVRTVGAYTEGVPLVR